MLLVSNRGFLSDERPPARWCGLSPAPWQNWAQRGRGQPLQVPHRDGKHRRREKKVSFPDRHPAKAVVLGLRMVGLILRFRKEAPLRLPRPEAFRETVRS